MGNFIGHAVPGTFFLLISFWWAWSILHRYFICLGIYKENPSRRNQGAFKYKNTCSFVSICGSRTLPLEGITKFVGSAIAILGECQFGLYGKHTHPINHENLQHMTILFFFALNGLMDVLLHYRVAFPPDMDYITGFLAFGVEALIFIYHIQGRSPLNIQIHLPLIYAVLLTILAAAVEMRNRNSVVPALCRVLFTMLQGTWFFQIAYILFPPSGVKLDGNDQEQIMMFGAYFAWHIACLFSVLVLLGICIYFRVKFMDKADIYQYLYPFVKLRATREDLDFGLDQSSLIIYESLDEETKIIT